MRTHIRHGASALALGIATLGAAAQAQTVAITGGTVFPVSGPKIEHGTVLMRDGKIVEVGASVVVPAGAQIVDATGKWVTPGLINANTSLGLTEAGSPEFSGGYNDTRAKGARGVAAAFKAWEGINPASMYIPQARQGGVTSVVVNPGGGLIAGQAAMIDLAGDKVDAMLVHRGASATSVAMIGAFSPGAAEAGARGELLSRLRELLQDAKVYAANRTAFERNATRAYAAPRGDLEALQLVIDTTIPLVLAVDRASDIRAVLDLTRRDRLPLRLMILGAAEGWQVAAELAAAEVPVLVGAMSNIPTSFDALASRQENAALLRAAGANVVIIGDGDDFKVQNIRQEAGNAVAYGLSWGDALRAVTLAPAEAYGVADKVGSLRAGREANVVVWSGDPFEFATTAEQVFIRGVRQVGTTRQDELTRRYR